MAVLLGLGPKTAKPIKYSGLQVGTSQLDIPIFIFWGQRRLDPNVIWYNNFQKHKAGKGGKGGGKGSGQYTYTAAVILALCEGPVDEVVTIWNSGTSKDTTTLVKLNLTFFDGSPSQAPWSYVVTAYPSEARAYPNTAYVASPKFDLGSSASVPSNAYELKRLPFAYTHPSVGFQGDTAYDCMMSDIVEDLLTNTQYGMGFTGADIGASLTQYSDYCRAQGLFFSPLLAGQESCNSIIDRWAALTNTWIYWTGTTVEFVPLADEAVTGNAVTYTPDNEVAYNITLADITSKDPPILVKRSDPADAFNRTRLQITDRTKAYVSNPIEFKDQTLVDMFGLRDNSSVAADDICDPEVGAVVAQLVGKRAAYLRNTYQLTLSYRFVRLLPGTIITLTDPNIGLENYPVRVKTVQETDTDEIEIVCEEWPGTIGTYTGLNLADDGGSGFPDTNTDPGDVNTPSVVEPDSSFTGGGNARLLVTASGGADWGGCFVYVSFDGTNYIQIGTITTRGYQGVLASALASHADPDTVNNVTIDATESLGVPTSVTNADANAFRTLSHFVDQPVADVLSNAGELIAFGDVNPISTYAAILSYFRRGVYGSTIGAWGIGDQFTLIDASGSLGCTINYNLPPQYIGSPIYFKFQSFNLFGNAIQDISLLTEYQYTPTGIGYGTGAGGVPSAPTGLANTAGSGFNSLSWTANAAADNVTTYQVWAAVGLAQPFGSATKIWEGNATSWVHNGIASGALYTYFIVAVNRVGSSSPSGGLSVTSSNITYALQMRGGTPGRAPNAGEELFAAAMIAGDKIAATMPSSLLQCEVAPTVNWVMTLKQNGTTIGTGTILAGATTGSWSFAGTITFAASDFFKGIAPAVADATVSGVSYTIVATRTT